MKQLGVERRTRDTEYEALDSEAQMVLMLLIPRRTTQGEMKGGLHIRLSARVEDFIRIVRQGSWPRYPANRGVIFKSLVLAERLVGELWLTTA